MKVSNFKSEGEDAADGSAFTTGFLPFLTPTFRSIRRDFPKIGARDPQFSQLHHRPQRQV